RANSQSNYNTGSHRPHDHHSPLKYIITSLFNPSSYLPPPPPPPPLPHHHHKHPLNISAGNVVKSPAISLVRGPRVARQSVHHQASLARSLRLKGKARASCG
ncbi:hypothetical protein ACJ72_08619, partial [Emergomyces africanus]